MSGRNLKVKVCGLRDAGNIVRISAAGPDILGFIFYPPSPRYVGEELDPEPLNSLSAGILKAGVFVNASPEEVRNTADRYGFDLVQLHGSESVEDCRVLKSLGFGVIKAFSLKKEFDFGILEGYRDFCDYFLFDTPTTGFGGSGAKFDWGMLEKAGIAHPFFLSGGIGPEDAKEIKELGLAGLAGVDINSRFEVSPGLKNVEDVRRFIEELKK